MPRHRSIFHQLLLLTLWSALPLTGILGFVAVEAYVSQQDETVVDLLAARDNAMQRLQGFLRDTSGKVRLLAQAPELADPSEAKRDAFLNRFATFHPEFVNLMWADRAGMVRASARFRENYPAASLTIDPYLRELLARHGTSVSRSVQGTISRRWSFYFVEQIAAGPRNESGTFILPVDLQNIAPRLLDRRFARDERVTVFDDTGRIIMDSQEPVRLIGTVYPDFAQLRAASADGTVRHHLPGIDAGPPMSVVALAVPGTPWLAAAHLLTRTALDEPRRRLLRNLASTLLVFGGLLLMLRRQTRRIAAPIRQLAAAAQAQAAGRHDATAPVAGPTEIVATAEAFNQMVAARSTAESALRAGEERYRLLFENMTAGFALHDIICNDAGRPTDYRYVEVNPAFERLTGLKAKAMIGRTVRELIPTIEDTWIEKYGHVALTGESINYRDYVRALQRYYDTFAFCPRRGQFAVVFTDVTEKELADQALRDATRRYEALVNSIDGIVWEYEPARRRFTFVSPRAEAIVGYPLRQWLEEESFWANHLHPDDRTRALEFVRQATTERRDHELDYRFLAADGRIVWLHDIATFATESNDSTRLRGVMLDITARKTTEDERQALERKLQETQKLESLGVLAGGIAHDFNNLLTGILGNANLAQAELPPGAPTLEFLAEIVTASQRAADLCRQMLAYSGKGRFIIQRVDLNRVVRELTHLLQISISKNAALRFNLAGRLPAFEADLTQLRQVLMNLVINASEALQERSGEISLTTGVVRVDAAYLQTTSFAPDLAPGEYVFLEVSDNGCGMDEATRARIFDPFFTTKFTGRGLGLAAVHGIIRGHRGAIKVYSEPGKGTSFKLLFPVAVGAATELEPGPAAPPTQWRGQGCVLIIDDEETVRTVAARMLERSGFTTESAADPRDGLARFAQDPARYTLVLLDLTMPHLNGEEVFRQLRAIRPGLKVILMSGFNEQDAINRFTGKGLAGFVPKPLELDALLAAVRRVVESP